MKRFVGILFGITAALAIGCGNSNTNPDGGSSTGSTGSTGHVNGGSTGAANNGGSTGSASTGAGTTGSANNGGSTGAGTTGSANNGGSTGAANPTFSLALAPTSVTIAPGTTQTTTVTITRSAGADSIAFTLSGASTGISGVFAPASTTLDTAVLTLTALATVPAGASSVNIVGTDSSVSPAAVQTIALPLTVSVPATTLLVDNDGNTSADETDISLPIFSALLTDASPAIAFNTYSEPSDGSDLTDPNSTALTGVNTIIWFTGDNYGGDPNWGTFSSAQFATLTAWLNAGGHTLIVFCPALNYDWNNNGWAGPPNAFLTLLGEVGGVYDPEDDVTSNNLNYDANNGGLTVTGVAGTPFAGLQWQINGSITDLHVDSEVINPATGVDTLVTVQADPTGSGTNSTVAIVTGNQHVGTAGTSTMVLVSTTFEDIFSPLTGFNSQTDMFTAIRAYAGF